MKNRKETPFSFVPVYIPDVYRETHHKQTGLNVKVNEAEKSQQLRGA